MIQRWPKKKNLIQIIKAPNHFPKINANKILRKIPQKSRIHQRISKKNHNQSEMIVYKKKEKRSWCRKPIRQMHIWIRTNIRRETMREHSLFGNSEGVVNESLHDPTNNNNFVFPNFEIFELSISATTKTAKPEFLFFF